MERSAALLWSGGKDSLMALEALRSSARVEVLVTTADERERVTAHGVPVALVRGQAAALGLPLQVVTVPQGAPNAVYEAHLGEALAALKAQGIGMVAAGDLFLEDVRRYRQHLIETAGLRATFPLWGRVSAELAEAFVARGFTALTVAVDPRALPESFVGRLYNRVLLRALPPNVDPCGERGEFHTFVTGGPTFRYPVRYRPGGVREGQLELFPVVEGGV
jgi:uncharacterized protein (TIGR00290 family)